ncbi:MAG: HEAT repeat domain-containing protein [Anaerolineae bacterium]|nr:HEAT repeat domain-containing protein [Anaerolineae bacterium]
MGQKDRLRTGREPSLSSESRPQSSGQEPRVGGDRAILHLAEMLQHDDPDVRTRAVFALAEFGDERALAHLMEIMQDGSQPWGVRERAAYSIGPIGEAAVPHLLSLLHADWNIYGDNPAAIGLGAVIRHHTSLSETVTPALIEVLDNTTKGTRVAAVQAMGKVGDPAFVPHLLEVLRSEHGRIEVCAAESLGMLGEKARMPEVFDALFDRLLDKHTEHGSVSPYAEALARIGDPQTIPQALTLIEQGEQHVANVIDQLVEGFREAATSHLLDWLRRVDSPYRPHVIAALGFTRDRRAVEALLEMLDAELEHQATIIEALGMLRDPLALPRLVDLLNEPAEPHLATRILWALGLVGDFGIAPLLLSYLENHTAGSLIAIRMLGEFKYAPAVPYLIGRLSQGSARATVITALVRIGTPEALSALARLVSPEEITTLPENLNPDALATIEALRANQ